MIISKAALLRLLACVALTFITDWCRGACVPTMVFQRGEETLNNSMPVYRVTGGDVDEVLCDPALLPGFTLDSLESKSVAANTDEYVLFFKAKNTDTLSLDFIFHLIVPRMDTIRYFEYRNDRLHKSYLTGDKFPLMSRPVAIGGYYFMIYLEAGEERQVFIQMKNQSGRVRFSYEILTGKAMLTRQATRNVAMFSCAGIIIATCLLGLFLFLHFMDWMYIKYIVYVSLVAVSVLLEEGYLFEFFLGNHPLFNEMLYYSTSLISIGFSILFVRSFIASQSNSVIEWILKIFNGVPFAAGIYGLAHGVVFSRMADEAVLSYLLYGNMMGASVLMFIFIFQEILAGNFRAKIYLLSLPVMMVAVALYALYQMGYFDNYFLRNNLLMLGLSFEAVVLSIYMVNRYRSLTLNETRLQLAMEMEKKENLIRLVGAQESERQRIAQDLHDGVAGYLGALRLFINSRVLHFRQNLQQTEAIRSLETIQEKIDVALHDIRNISHNLMPSDFETTRLSTTLENYFSELNENRNNIRFSFMSDESINRMLKSYQINVYRIIVELTSNIIRHAEATEATVQCLDYESYFLIQIEDNGKGFRDEGKQDGIGLKNVKSRVDLMKGEMKIDSKGSSTTIIIEIPDSKE